MHNGNVGHFLRIKRALIQRLSERIYFNINGTSDTEHCFALFLDLLPSKVEISAEDIKITLIKTIHILVSLVHIVEKADRMVTHTPSTLNFAVTDGKSVLVTRYTDDPKLEPRSLYYHAFDKYICTGKECRIIPSKAGQRPKAVIVSSEPVTRDEGWHLIERNHLITIFEDNSLKIEEIPETPQDREAAMEEWRSKKAHYSSL